MKISDICQFLGCIAIMLILAFVSHSEIQWLIALPISFGLAYMIVGCTIACGLLSFWYVYQKKIEEEWSVGMYFILVACIIFWFVALPIALRVFRGRRQAMADTDKTETV